ncbi:IS3 family transposase [Tepidanaerobacter syntrophicus]|uniref:IS3 family transposase n=1 Tax=Tepidanaerobacter syntrophicus TaxID=224999 RepID=UPI001BD57C89
MKEYDERFRHIFGYCRMTACINHFNETHYSKNRIHSIMKELKIRFVIHKKEEKVYNFYF